MHRKEQIPIDTSKGYETHDLPIKGVTIGVTAFFIFTIVSGIFGLLFLAFIPGGGLGAKELPPRRMVPQEPAPILQNDVTVKTDMYNLRALEKTQMESGGWVDRSKGIVRIPVEDAINLEAQKSGLPSGVEQAPRGRRRGGGQGGGGGMSPT